MKKFLIALGAIVVLGAGYFFIMNKDTSNMPPADLQAQNNATSTDTTTGTPVTVHPIMHATMRLDWGGEAIYTDPVGSSTLFDGMPDANLILITDIHPDHLDLAALTLLTKSGTILVAPKAVADKLTPALLAQTVVLANGSTTEQAGFSIEAIPMYNLPESATAYHTKGRGNGYVIERSGERVYVAGDTSDIPEMRALQNIDIAFVPMNLPYTMSVETAADAVLAFTPKHVYPYHYRNADGLSDVAKFKQLVNDGNPSIDVELLNWYPAAQ